MIHTLTCLKKNQFIIISFNTDLIDLLMRKKVKQPDLTDSNDGIAVK